MRAIMEPLFYFLYLFAILFAGGFLVYRGVKDKKEGKPPHSILLGCACILLGSGDAFHLIPRAIGLFTKTLDNPDPTLAFYLGVGKLITSVTMTLFYVLLYLHFRNRGAFPKLLSLDIAVGILSATRIALLCFPQNGWAENASPLDWGIYRNIPFALLGVMVIVLCFRFLWNVKPYRPLGILIIASFAFYLPVVLFAADYSWVGFFMLPKTVCYLWIAILFLRDYWPKKKEA